MVRNPYLDSHADTYPKMEAESTRPKCGIAESDRLPQPRRQQHLPSCTRRYSALVQSYPTANVSLRKFSDLLFRRTFSAVS